MNTFVMKTEISSGPFLEGPREVLYLVGAQETAAEPSPLWPVWSHWLCSVAAAQVCPVSQGAVSVRIQGCRWGGGWAAGGRVTSRVRAGLEYSSLGLSSSSAALSCDFLPQGLRLCNGHSRGTCLVGWCADQRSLPGAFCSVLIECFCWSCHQ